MQHTFSGTVIKGDGRGKTIGYPTANIDISDLDLAIKTGVYGSTVQIENNPETFKAILFFGPKKTFNGVENNLEIFILNFDQDIYGKTVHFTIEQFVRGPIKFNSVEELVKQIKADIEQIK